jgi:hypothetical protein
MANINPFSNCCPVGTIPSHSDRFIRNSELPEQPETIRRNSMLDIVTRCQTVCPIAKRHPYSIPSQERPTRDDPCQLGTIRSSPGRFRTIHAKQRRARWCDVAQQGVLIGRPRHTYSIQRHERPRYGRLGTFRGYSGRPIRSCRYIHDLPFE